ncbi:hypothetical protein GQ42DRAFT_50824 [Ramicandelaber brevisporus]|nr:hypothetical protein GQ42DRAFT_50824 [Ramicandelaber brevisporus]
MATLNIGGDQSDAYYRYKMQPIQAKVEGKGNGIKTAIPNMVEVAKALDRPPAYPAKFFGYELGALTTVDADQDRYIVNGAHTAQKLQELLGVFIEKFVLCASCGNPETVYEIATKPESIIRCCKACGKRSPVDMRHKLASFIVKNPPGGAGSGAGGKNLSKKDRRKAKDGKRKAGGDDQTESPEQSTQQDSRGATDDEAEPGLTEADLADDVSFLLGGRSTKNDDEFTSVDMSPAAILERQKMNALSNRLEASLAMADEDDDEDDEDASPYDVLCDFIDAARTNLDETSTELVPSNAEVIATAKSLGIDKDVEAVAPLVASIFTPANWPTTIVKRADLFKSFGTSDKHQRAIIGGIEILVSLVHTSLLAKVNNILMKLYEEEALSEESILKWHSKGSKRYVDKNENSAARKAADKFVEWLKTADEDDSDDSDDE